MKRLITGTALAAGYIFLCYWQRGYLNLMSDLIVIAMAVVAYVVFSETEEGFGDVQEAAGMYERWHDDAAWAKKVPVSK